jgi:hypothetical protein
MYSQEDPPEKQQAEFHELVGLVGLGMLIVMILIVI